MTEQKYCQPECADIQMAFGEVGDAGLVDQEIRVLGQDSHGLPLYIGTKCKSINIAKKAYINDVLLLPFTIVAELLGAGYGSNLTLTVFS